MTTVTEFYEALERAVEKIDGFGTTRVEITLANSAWEHIFRAAEEAVGDYQRAEVKAFFDAFAASATRV